MSYDLWFNRDADVLPVVTSPLGRATEMRDRYDLDVQLLADPDGEVAERYNGTEETSHGVTGVPDTHVINGDRTVRREQVADRTYGNWVRSSVRNHYEEVISGG